MTQAAPGTFLYFAYGSNMASRRLRANNRCPSAKALGPALLPGYELRWHKRSVDGSGKCDVVRVDGAKGVHGVLFQIAESERAALHRAEGLGNGYDERVVEVLHGEEAVKAAAYVATDTSPSLKPYNWYKAWVVEGAREHHLPDAYVAALVATPANVDPDASRARREGAGA